MTELTPPDVIVFDWDNTLVDTWPVIHLALEETFTAMGHTPWTLEETKSRVSNSLRDAFPGFFGDRWTEAAKIFYGAFEKHHLVQLEPLSGAETLLSNLKQCAVPAAIVSNKKGDYLRREIKHLGWDGYFGPVSGAGDGDRDKPHPDALKGVLEPLNRAFGSDIWFIGDSRSDMELGHATGCTTILIHEDPQQVELYHDVPPHKQFINISSLDAFLKSYYTES